MPQPSDSENVPSAPYPPMHMVSPARSALSASPQYRTRSDLMSAPNVGTSPITTSNVLAENEVDGVGSSVPPRPQFAETSLKSHRSQQAKIPRVKFYSDGSLACINTAEPINRTSENETGKKLGPVLLELRKLEVNDKDEDQLFHTKRIALSRGNPQLGTSVASTCLDLPGNNQYTGRLAAATGLTTGMLALHTFSESPSSDTLPYSSTIEYFHTSRHHRQATAVSWRSSHENHIAIGLLGTGSNPGPQQGPRRGGAAMRGGGGDREFCCFLWDVEAAAGKRNASPVTKVSHNTPVASLAWILEGQTLAVGTHARNIHLYDMREPGTGTPPLSALAHNFGVHGIEVDPYKPNILATFCRSTGEPVKLWDVRRMDSVMSEIKIRNSTTAGKNAEYANEQGKVETIRWSKVESGVLSIAIQSAIKDYDTSAGSRPVLIRESLSKDLIRDFVLFGGDFKQPMLGKETPTDTMRHRLSTALYSRRAMTILSDGSLCDMAKHGYNSPVAISRRDGRLLHSFGSSVWVGSSVSGTTAMEGSFASHNEDISASMIRRAGCNNAIKYSMDTSQNIKMLAREFSSSTVGVSKEDILSHLALYRLWVWIERVEALSLDLDEAESELSWPIRSLLQAGVLDILGNSGNEATEVVTISETFGCYVYSSIARSLALTSCGWAGKFSLEIVLAECEALGEHERSAALAVWHGDIGAAVHALQRASGVAREAMSKSTTTEIPFTSPQYAETLDLVAMCVAGYSGTPSAQKVVWQNACSKLLQHPELADSETRTSRTVYLRSMCHFLLNVGLDNTFEYILGNEYLAYNDRIAFACRFLDKQSLNEYLHLCLEESQQTGNMEGLTITGMSKEGIKIMQAYVDQTSDVQTAALVVSRVLLPQEWTDERRISMEWVEAYRSLLNSWQMWQSRAMFDVDRADTLRQMKAKANDPNAARRIHGRRQGQRSAALDAMASIPAALDARCNYCASPLGLRRHEGNANQWLSKMKPVLSCCPQCRKPLPRCSICLLGLGVLNPYMQLTREMSRPVSRNPASGQDDLGALPLAEWFTWCMNCKHGGHAHHLLGWFANHETCPVSGCECHCQFDGIKSLARPAFK